MTMSHQVYNTNRDRNDKKNLKKQTEILKLKSTITKMKNSLEEP